MSTELMTLLVKLITSIVCKTAFIIEQTYRHVFTSSPPPPPYTVCDGFEV